MTDSRPQLEDEKNRIKDEMLEHANDDRWWRIKQAEAFAELRAGQRYSEMRADVHEKMDNVRFAHIEKQFGAVTSSVVTVRESGTISIKNAILGVLSAMAFFGSCILTIWIALRGKP